MKSENKEMAENKDEIPFKTSVYNQNNFKDFCELETDWNIKSIDRNDLPKELSEKTCTFIDIFRRKTANEKTEWNFYIDYENDEIIHCLHGTKTSVKEWINSGLMENRKIITIHNHPSKTYSAPSAKNFEILEHSFEDYEIICSKKEYWILKAKETYDEMFQKEFKKEIEAIFNYCDSFRKMKHIDTDKMYSERLTKYIYSEHTDISLIRKEYVENG